MARELGLTTEPLRLGRKPADLDDGTRRDGLSRDGLSRDEQEERRRLRREHRLLRAERAILKQAAAFCAQETGSLR